MDLTGYKHYCDEKEAPRFSRWMQEQGGLALWGNNYIGDDTRWTTPVLQANGSPSPRPNWRATSQPVATYTDPADIGVITYVEYKRFRVGLRMGSQGMSMKLTDASNRRLSTYLAEAGPGATYRFDYEHQLAIILKPLAVVSLADWMAQQPPVLQSHQ